MEANMVAKARADRPGAIGATVTQEAEDPDLELEIRAVAALFEATPLQWQRYFDEEARNGRQAYGPS